MINIKGIKKKLLVLLLAFSVIIPLTAYAIEPSEDKEKDKKEDTQTTIVTVSDKIDYEDLIIGKQYTVKGTLMDKKTNQPFTVDKVEIKIEKQFTPEANNGSVDIEYTFDTKDIAEDTDLVSFVELYNGDKLVAEHKDIEDVGQTIKLRKPNVGTTATVNDEKEVEDVGDITIKDVVKYKGLIIGKEYTVKGILMDKETNSPLLVEGQEIKAETTFVAEKNDGEVTLEFKFSTKGLEKTKDVVAFEDIYNGNRKVGTHADIEDENQTVKVRKSKIRTTATINGEKEIEVTYVDSKENKEKAESVDGKETEKPVSDSSHANVEEK